MKGANRLYLVRHGQVLGYETFPIYGHTDVDLTEVGIIQMEHLAERLRLAEIHEVYSSDLKRCMRGARIIARSHDVPIHPKPDLRELHFGAWEGLTLAEIRERYPDELEMRERDLLGFAPTDGESIASLAARVMGCFESIMRLFDAKNILLAGHGVVNRVILCDALGLDYRRMFSIQQDYGCLNIIDYYPDRKLVRLVNG